MKKALCFTIALVIMCSFAAILTPAVDYTAFDIVFEEKEGENVNGTEIKIFASVGEDKLVDRTGEFTLEGVEWFRYLHAPEDEKTAEDYDYVDEELEIYGMLCGDGDVFEHDSYDYFLRIARLYAKEEDSFSRNVCINGVDIEELNGLCFNTGSEFFIKTVTNGMGGIPDEGDVTEESGDVSGSGKDEKDEKNKCKVCGICPIQPLGICLFIWIAIIILIVIVVIVLVTKSKKKENNNNKEN